MEKLGTELLKRSNKTIYRSEDGKMLIKVFNHEIVSKGDVLQEAETQARVEETDMINIPRIQEVFKHGDDWCIACDFIQGDTLDKLLEQHPEKADEYLEKMVQLQIEMHKINVNKLHRLTTTMQERISSLKEVIPATARYELHVRLDAMPKHVKLCHLDYNPTNIIVGDDGKWYITDWAHARKGNASADIAATYLYFASHNQPEYAKKYLQIFCRLTDTAIQYVQRWMPIVGAFMLTRNGLTDEEKAFLEDTTDVVEYE